MEIEDTAERITQEIYAQIDRQRGTEIAGLDIYTKIKVALTERNREIETLRAASQLALDCHYHDEPHCECWITSARAAAQVAP